MIVYTSQYVNDYHPIEESLNIIYSYGKKNNSYGKKEVWKLTWLWKIAGVHHISAYRSGKLTQLWKITIYDR